MNYLEQYELWCKDSYFDEETKKEVSSLEEGEIKERFYKNLEFGTGGLRGEMGAGTNRMNIYTVRKATQGLANYIIKKGGQKRGVAIAYDSRNRSPEFAHEAALCFCANGIHTYLFEDLRPTPELSFAVRKLNCQAGIVITASHNPPEYNGYKVYWEDGGQITNPRDKEIISEVQSIDSYHFVKTMAKEEAVQTGFYHIIGEDIDRCYLEEIKKLVSNRKALKEQAKELQIVYSPLHGSGNIPVCRILEELGFENVHVVPEQQQPDGDFPTIAYPNPEDPDAFKLGLELARRVGADLLVATDPDADRLGVYGKSDKAGDYRAFSGNMSGALICEYLLSQKKVQGKLPSNGAVVTTIVSGNMAKAIAKEYGVSLVETLTGFKYIGEQMKRFEENHTFEYLFGFEESYGCLIGSYARDKDAVSAVMTLCEAAAYYKGKGLSLWEQMLNLYEKYGYYKESLHTATFKGVEGTERIRAVMQSIRANPMHSIGPYKVTAFYDYGQGKVNQLPKSDVVYLELEEDGWCCVRPSGTEPKIKIYAGVKGDSLEDSEDKLQKLMNHLISSILDKYN